MGKVEKIGGGERISPMNILTLLAAVFWSAQSPACVHEVRTTGVERRVSIPRAIYRDKMAGAWLGQSIGVAYGWPTEFRYNGKLVPEEKMPVWKPEMINETFNQDDLYVEMTFLKTLLDYGKEVSPLIAGRCFANSIYRLWCANDNARNNIRRGIDAPQSSDPANHATTDDIDFQIESDFSGILSPGNPENVKRLCGIFGRIMNSGDGYYAGVFTGGMYAEAFLTDDRVRIVENALSLIPAESGYAEMVRDMLAWYRTDPKDWEKAWHLAVDKYYADGKSPKRGRTSNPEIDVKVNGAMVLLGYLWGEGDIERTIRISTRGGFDSDCNPSTACGVLCTSIGESRIPARFKEKLDRTKCWEHTEFTFPKLLEVCERIVYDSPPPTETAVPEVRYLPTEHPGAKSVPRPVLRIGGKL